MVSEAHKRGLDFIRKRQREGADKITIQLEFPELRQGQFVVNRVYQFEPIIVGMYSPGSSMIGFSRGLLRRIMAFAREKGYKLKIHGSDIFLEKERERVAWLRENFFGASLPQIFEEIGTRIYCLGTVQDASVRFRLDALANKDPSIR